MRHACSMHSPVIRRLFPHWMLVSQSFPILLASLPILCHSLRMMFRDTRIRPLVKSRKPNRIPAFMRRSTLARQCLNGDWQSYILTLPFRCPPSSQFYCCIRPNTKNSESFTTSYSMHHVAVPSMWNRLLYGRCSDGY
ncbi:hypothetical protein DFH29DRAFT_929917 [Suillus ampliporus]|nr:hypothetical protein DFH29DRAFT_929917 [Suillus ampliporus]